MSLDFFIHNMRFAVELAGAVAFLMASWLTLDTYNLRKDGEVLVRSLGFGCFALYELIDALSLGSDVLSYTAFAILLLGLILILGSFVRSHAFQVQAVVVIPTFTLYRGYLSALAALFLFAISYFAYRREKSEMNKTWTPLIIGFLLLAVNFALALIWQDETSAPALVGLLCEVAGFFFVARWVWQFLELRIRESLVLIFLSAALFLSTVVTLAFSTILVSQIANETDTSLTTDAKVLDLTVNSLKDESLAKTAIIAQDSDLKSAIVKNDFPSLQQAAENLMEQYQLGFVTITDKDGTVLIRAHALSKRGDSLLGERALEEALRGNTFVTIEESPVEKLSVRAGAPILSLPSGKDAGGKVIGTVVAGYPLDNALADDIKRVTGLEMFIYTGDTATAATALAADGRTRLTGFAITDGSVKAMVLQNGKTATSRAVLYGEPYRTSYLPLINGDDKIIGMLSAGKPEQDILDIANATNRLTLITVICIMLLLAWPIYSITKRLASETI